MRTGDEITLDALRREHVRVSRIATKAKAEADEYMGVSEEAFAIHNEFAEIVNTKAHGPHVLRHLDELKKRRAKVDAIQAKDFVQLLDDKFEAEWDQAQVAREISAVEFRLSLRKSG